MKGQPRPPLRRLLHAHERRPHVRRVRELGRVAQHARRPRCPRSTTSSAARSAGSRARSTRNGYPGGTYTTPVGFPSFTEQQQATTSSPLYANDTWSVTDRLKLNLGLRYEYFGPQKKSEPKYDSNFYYSDDELLGEHEQPARRSSTASAGGTVVPDEREPDRRAVEERLEQLRPPRRLRLGRHRRRQDEPPRRLRHGLRAQLRQRDLQRALQPAAVPRRLDRRARRTCRRCRSTPTTRARSAASPASPRRSRRAACATSTRTSRPPTTTSTACRCSARSFANTVASDRVHRLDRAASSTTSPTPTSAARALVYEGIGTAEPAAAHPVRGLQHPRQPRPVAVPRRDLRPRVAQARQHRPAVHGEVHARRRRRTTSARRSPTRQRTSTSATSTRSTRCSTTATPSSTSATALIFAGIWELPLFRNSEGVDQDAPRRLAAQLDLHRPHRLSVHACATARTASATACAPRTRSASTRTPRTARPPATRTSSSCSTCRRSSATAGGYVNPITGNSDFGPYPADMTKRDAFRGPGAWNFDLSLSKRFRFGDRYAAAAAVRGVQRVQPREHVRVTRQRRRQQLHDDHRLQGRQPPHPARGEVRVLA